MTIELEKLLCAIPKGKENAVHNEELAKKFGVSTTKIKNLIHEAREHGVPIASGMLGYWITEDREEIQKFVNSMDKSAIKRIATTKALKHMLSVTEGQITLPNVLSDNNAEGELR